MKRIGLTCCGAILLLGAGLWPVAGTSALDDDNLISNPGFEISRWNALASWRLSEGAEGNTFEWVHRDAGSDEVHTGARALRMSAMHAPPAERSMDATSNPFRVPPYARVEASVWLKAGDVVGQDNVDWYGLRVTLTARNSAGLKIEHWDLLTEQGSFSWKKIQGGMMVPEGTASMDLSIKLTTCTGTVWIDDARVRVAEELPAVDLTGVRSPVLIPHPWQCRLEGERLELRGVSITGAAQDPCLGAAARALFTSLGVAHEFAAGQASWSGHYTTRLVLGDGTQRELAREFSRCFPGYGWADLEEQGYFLAVVKGEGRSHIYVGANSPVGRFYALQTLRQLVQGEPTTRTRHIHEAEILDKPTVTCRGIPMGLQWFERRSGEALRRLTQLKFNFVWVQGSFLDNYLDTDNWRRDFTPAQETLLREFFDLYRRNFLDVWMAIGPRGKNPPLQYSSDRDIDLVVRKMDTLYRLGLRNFGLRFDDLANVGEDTLLVPQDVQIFQNDIGAAQVHFIQEVHGRLKALHPDIRFMVVPMDYSQTGNYGDGTASTQRLRQFSRLPAEIGIYSVSYYDDDVLAATHLTGRPTVAIVSNFYAEGHGDPTEYTIPYVNFIGWQDVAVRARIAGFTWLPRIPQGEDAALISWHTAADFAWAPERYEPHRSFQSAAARYLGVPEAAPAPVAPARR